MAVPGSANPMLLGGLAAEYEIEQSLRFNENDSTYLYSNIAATATDDQIYTLSFWIKRAFVGNDEYCFWCGPTSSTTGAIAIGFDSGYGTDELWLGMGLAGNPFREARSNAAYRDPAAWMHVVVAVDSTQSAAGDIQKAWVNGEAVSWASQANLNGYSFQYGSGNLIQLGAYMSSGGTRAYYSGSYIAEYHFIDGQQLDHTSFGEFDDNGVWRPIEYAGTYGNVGFYLKFDPSATNGIGHDHSGNGNNFTASGFTTSGTGTDVMSDTPTTNWCTWNPLRPSQMAGGSATISNGNLNAADAGTSYGVAAQGTIAVSSGKWYWEIDATTVGGSYGAIGIRLETLQGTDGAGYFYASSGGKGTSVYSPSSAYGNSYTSGDNIGVALDLTNGKIWFAKNGTWQASGNPAAGTNEAFSGLSGLFSACVGDGQNATSYSWDANFGQRAFAYTPPTGFEALNTANLPAPDIADGSEYFNTVTYTGTGAALSITGVGFQPDFIWFKRRSHAENHWLQDAVRGVTKGLYSNLPDAEDTRTDQLQSFDSDGFSLGVDAAGYTNISTRTYVAWNWLAGGSGSSNTDGSITSTVSANPSAGFSIVSFTTNNTAGATVGHGLGVAPDMIIMKYRGLTANWVVYHKNMNATPQNGYLNLNTTAGYAALTDPWNNTAPSSSVITMGAGVGSAGSTNYGTYTSIAYCFAEVEGYSKIGSYTGNGSTDGPFVYCGFKPAFVLFKRTDSAINWGICDAKRPEYNKVTQILFPDLSNQEDSTSDGFFDFCSNGLKIRTNNAMNNASGGTYIFMALAENPFGGDGVSPATAR